MKNSIYLIKIITILSMFATSSVFATGATVRLANNIPTLSGTMLVVLSLLLFAVAYRITKQKNSATGKLFVTLIGVTAIAMGGSGIKLISDVKAGSFMGIPLDMPVITLPGGFSGPLFNNSGEDVTIQSITPDATSTCSFQGMDSCFGLPIPLTAPITLPPMQACFINCQPTLIILNRPATE